METSQAMKDRYWQFCSLLERYASQCGTPQDDAEDARGLVEYILDEIGPLPEGTERVAQVSNEVLLRACCEMLGYLLVKANKCGPKTFVFQLHEGIMEFANHINERTESQERTSEAHARKRKRLYD